MKNKCKEERGDAREKSFINQENFVTDSSGPAEPVGPGHNRKNISSVRANIQFQILTSFPIFVASYPEIGLVATCWKEINCN